MLDTELTLGGKTPSFADICRGFTISLSCPFCFCMSSILAMVSRMSLVILAVLLEVSGEMGSVLRLQLTLLSREAGDPLGHWTSCTGR